MPLVGAGASLIWVVSVAVVLLIGLIVPFLHFGTDVKIAILVMTMATMATFHSAGYSAVLRAFEDNELNNLGFVLHKVLLLGLIVVMIKLKMGLIGFVTAHLVSNVFLWNFYHIVVSRLYARIPLRIDVSVWKSLLAAGLPMGGGVMDDKLNDGRLI